MTLKLTPELQEQFCRYVAMGNPICTACQLVGLGEGTYYKWKVRGRDHDEEPFSSFVKAVDLAEAQAVNRNITLIQKAATEQWQAAAWYLERRYPESFGRRILEVNQNTRVEVNLTVTHSVDALMQEFRALKLDHLALPGEPVDAVDSEGERSGQT